MVVNKELWDAGRGRRPSQGVGTCYQNGRHGLNPKAGGADSRRKTTKLVYTFIAGTSFCFLKTLLN